MLKSIFVQLWNRRRSNGWIFLELLLVFCLVWYMVDYFFMLGWNYNLKSYRDTDYTYQVILAQFPEDHPDFKEEANDPEVKEANYTRILNHIRIYPGVEAVAVSFSHSTPGSDNYASTGIRNQKDTTLVAYPQQFWISPQGDYFRVFGHSQDKGTKKVSMSDFDWANPNAVVIDKLTEEALFAGESAVGKLIEDPYAKSLYEVVGVLDNIKRFDIERPSAVMYRSERLEASTISDVEISIRINEKTGSKQFIEEFKEQMNNDLQLGNFYLQGIEPYNDLMAELDNSYGYTTVRRVRLYMMLFFLLCLILCVMGTFWYRIHIRREELGIRMALGASRSQIAVLLIGEGVCLLALVVIPAVIIEFQFVHAGLIRTITAQGNYLNALPDNIPLRFLLTNILTGFMLVFFIAVAILFPAYRASQMAPADALHDE